MANPENRFVSNQKFYGGMSTDPALGTEASFAYGRAIEHRRNPSQLTVLPGARKISAGVVTDLILNIRQVLNGTRYAIGNTGKVYKIATNNNVTLVGSLPSGSDGMVYRSDSDACYMASQTNVHRLYPASGAATLDQTLGPSRSIDSKAYRTGGTNSYTLPTALDETKQFSFQPDIEPFYSIKVKVVAKGTGDWTLTLHDGLNTVLATKTIPNASLTNGQLAEFVFDQQVRALVKPNARTYHVHLTSTVADGTVQVATANDLSTADFELWADRLVRTTNGLHPMVQFLQYNLIGNGNYLAVWEPLSPSDPPNNEFQRHRLTFPAGYEVCGIDFTDEFAVIACEKRSTDSTKDFQEGKLFIWDGVAQTYNYAIDVAGGSPEAITTHGNYPYFFVNGALCAWPGGKTIVQVRTITDTDTTYRDRIDATRVYPNMMTIRDNLLHLGYPSVTNNRSVEHGVHSWGTLEKNYPATWGNLNYVISTGTVKNTGTNNLELGCVRNFGDELYISWRDGANYGLDIVDSYSDPAPVFSYRARRFDAGAVYKEKQALRTAINTAALPAGSTIRPVYQIDEQPEKVQTEFEMTQGDSETIATIEQGSFRRITYGFDGTCSGSETPVIYCNTLSWNAQVERRPF